MWYIHTKEYYAATKELSINIYYKMVDTEKHYAKEITYCIIRFIYIMPIIGKSRQTKAN